MNKQIWLAIRFLDQFDITFCCIPYEGIPSSAQLLWHVQWDQYTVFTCSILADNKDSWIFPAIVETEHVDQPLNYRLEKYIKGLLSYQLVKRSIKSNDSQKFPTFTMRSFFKRSCVALLNLKYSLLGTFISFERVYYMSTRVAVSKAVKYWHSLLTGQSRLMLPAVMMVESSFVNFSSTFCFAMVISFLIPLT